MLMTSRRTENRVIRHIVVFEVSKQDDARLERLIGLLNQLPDRIEEIQSLSCGRAIQGNSSAAIVVDVLDWDALNRYRTHQEHQESLHLLREIASSVVVADIEVM